MPIDGQVKTTGYFHEESEALAEFDSIVNASGSFRLIPEVEGEYVCPRYGTEAKGARIDRILMPLKKAVDAGWNGGAIGIEAKRSGAKIGRLVSQAIDYSRCVFELRSPPGLLVMLKWIFIFPAEMQTCDLASVMAQNRIGTCWLINDRLTFSCGGMNGISIWSDGRIEAKQLPMGGKRGSR